MINEQVTKLYQYHSTHPEFVDTSTFVTMCGVWFNEAVECIEVCRALGTKDKDYPTWWALREKALNRLNFYRSKIKLYDHDNYLLLTRELK